jgi:tripartite-type tricarboxylate transporter receptor subunit TctC
MTEVWKQSIIVENRPGASGLIGAEQVAQSPADGYTLLMGSTAAVTEKNIAQFSPVALVSASPYVVTVNPSLNINSIKALIAYAKANPGSVRYGSSGPGSASHLAGELFSSMAGVTLLHVPYKGTGQALTDLLAGNGFHTESATTRNDDSRACVIGVFKNARNVDHHALELFRHVVQGAVGINNREL